MAGHSSSLLTTYVQRIRLAALQKVPVTYVLTHDSVAVGEDGPTHEPIEQLASVRCIPNVHVIRPADGNETVLCLENCYDFYGNTNYFSSKSSKLTCFRRNVRTRF